MPRNMQIKFIASDHKSVIEDTNKLQAKYDKLDKTLPKKTPMPKDFIGYIFKPNNYYFYSVNFGNFADKFIATNIDGKWTINKLQP